VREEAEEADEIAYPTEEKTNAGEHVNSGTHGAAIGVEVNSRKQLLEAVLWDVVATYYFLRFSSITNTLGLPLNPLGRSPRPHKAITNASLSVSPSSS
jgi:hypothetical protein